MKKILLLCLVCIAVGAKAQNNIKLPLRDSAVVYENTIKVSGANDKLFAQAQSWLDDQFKDSKSFISVKDKEKLQLSGKGFIMYLSGNNDPDTFLTYNIDVTIKDGGYAYKVYNVSYLYGTTETSVEKEYSHYLHGEIHKVSLMESKRSARVRLEAEFVFADQSINGIVASLKEAMNTVN